MEKPSLLRYVANLDDGDGPDDVLDILALEEFCAGAHPFSKTVALKAVHPGSPPEPTGFATVRTAVTPWRTVTLMTGECWTIKAQVYEEGNAVLTVTGATSEEVERLVEEVSAKWGRPAPARIDGIEVAFWNISPHGAARASRRIAAPPWPEVRRNYSYSVASGLDEIMALSPPKLNGRIVILHGPPGTGKTSVVRAIGDAWRSWCDIECVLDPEILLADPSYLTKVVLGPRAEGEDSQRWRLLVLEDCGELIRGSATMAAGLGRLLNLTDGLLGQGRHILVCLTTNLAPGSLDPAVTRPGRCMAVIGVGRLTGAEAAQWLGVDGNPFPAGASLAELFAARDGHSSSSSDTFPPIGQYL